MAEFEIKPSEDSIKSIAELRKEMKALKDEQAAAVQGSEQWTNAAARIGEIEDQLAAANEQAKIFAAGTSFEKTQNALAGLKEGILGLDFGKAKESASALNKVLKNFKPEEVTESLKDLVGTFKSLGQSVLQFGKILLTNPIFLLAAVITAIVVVIVKLLKEAGVLKAVMDGLKPVFEAVQAAIDGVVQAFKDLADWIGITNNAEIDAAQKSADVSKKRADASEEATNAIVASMDFEIAKLKLKGELNDEDFEKTLSYEAQKRKALADTAKERLAEAQAALKAAQLKGDLDEKELADLAKKVKEAEALTLAAERQVELGELEAAKAREDRRKKEQERIDAANKTAADKRKEAAAKRKQQEEAEEKARVDALRKIEDIKNSLIEDSTERELAILKTGYQRDLEELKKNTLLKAEVRAQLEAQLEAQYNAEKKKIEDERAKEDRARAFQAQQNVDAAILEARKIGNKAFEDDEKLSFDERKARSQKRQAELVAQENTAYREQVENLDESLKNQEITLEEYNAQKELLTKQNQATITEIEKTEADKRVEIAKEEQEKKIKDNIKMYEGFIMTLNSIRAEGNQLGVDLATNTLQAIKGFSELALVEFEKVSEKIAAYTQVLADSISGILSAISEAQRMKTEEDLMLLEEQSNAEQAELQRRYEQGLITKEQYDQALLNSQKNLDAKSLAIKKKAFETEKKLKIVEATMAGISGAIMAFVGPFSNPALVVSGVAPILGGIMAGLVGAMTAVNIAKIASQKFQGGGGSGASVPSGGGNPASAIPQPSQPTFMGAGNQANTATSTQSVEAQPQQITVTAVVSETEVTSTQERVAKMNSNAEL